MRGSAASRRTSAVFWRVCDDKASFLLLQPGSSYGGRVSAVMYEGSQIQDVPHRVPRIEFFDVVVAQLSVSIFKVLRSTSLNKHGTDDARYSTTLGSASPPPMNRLYESAKLLRKKDELQGISHPCTPWTSSLVVPDGLSDLQVLTLTLPGVSYRDPGLTDAGNRRWYERYNNSTRIVFG